MFSQSKEEFLQTYHRLNNNARIKAINQIYRLTKNYDFDRIEYDYDFDTVLVIKLYKNEKKPFVFQHHNYKGGD